MFRDRSRAALLASENHADILLCPPDPDHLRKLSRAILMAESNGYHIPDYADKVYVIERGEIVFRGTVAEARANAMVSRIIGS